MSTQEQLFTLERGQCIEGRFESKGSKFLAYLFALELSEECPTPKAALQKRIEGLKREHTKAVHFVSAVRFLDFANFSYEGHSVLSDKAGSLIVGSGYYRLGSSLASNLHNPDFSSQILECPGKPSAEIQENTESRVGLDSRFNNSDSESSFTDSKTITESTTSKNFSEALPDSNNSVCGSTSRAQLQNCAIFAEQKSNKMCSASAHTDTRPLRGVQSLEQGGSSASATIALEADKRGSPLDCRKSGGFFGAKGSGEGITPLFAKKQNDFENLGSIRENTTLRNLESTESKADSESKAENLGSTESKTFTESSPTDSKVITESKEILNNEQRQSPSGVEPRFKVLELDSESSSTDSKTLTQSTNTKKHNPTNKKRDSKKSSTHLRSAKTNPTHDESTKQPSYQILESSSDDGEPKGSSGVPCLNVLRGEKLINVACVVVRYFGGTLLGVGGLVRAYTAATHDAIANAKATHALIPFTQQHTIALFVPYAHFSRAEYLAKSLSLTIVKQDFRESGVEILCQGTQKALETFKNKL